MGSSQPVAVPMYQISTQSDEQFGNSQAALLAIESSKVKSRLGLECKKTLNDLASRNKLILTWVPGYLAARGNEEADTLAREG
ncbi:hypothetical protein NQ317_004875 [Molorchus minor]|uniref:RNase H type-1 domain-containing protein n=1 Tax=Molorchus minor TaxID=1323400 RepID=A0ABQ9JHE9_9CUCU|nr:hypothetical protein NQ317_004875 [Molorchus minor]